MAECWLNANTPGTQGLILAPEDYDPVAVVAFLGDAMDDSEPQSRAWQLMADTVTWLDAAANAESQQGVFITPPRSTVPYIFEPESTI